MILGVTDLNTYILGAIGIVLLPGPNCIYCLTVSGRYGIKAAYYALAGILIGDSILMLLSALGAASILKTMPMLFNTIKIIGGVYLVYLGYGLCRAAWQKWQSASVGTQAAISRQSEQSLSSETTVSPLHLWRHACLLSLSNPKGILFCLAFFIQFINPHYAHPSLSFLLLAVILLFLNSCYVSILIWSGRALVSWFRRYRRIAAMAMACIGLLFMSFAAKLWTVVIN